MTAVAVVILVTSLVAIEINSAYSSAAKVSSRSSQQSSHSQLPSTYSVTAPSGLELNLNLNATTIGMGSALGAQISFYNPLDQNLSVSIANSPNSTIAAWTNDDFVCGDNTLFSLGAYALFQGHYSSENLSSAVTPLWLAPPVALPCIVQGSDSVVFLPDSSNASLGVLGGLYRLATNATTEYCGNASDTHCPEGTSLFGYWAPVKGYLDLGAATTSSPYFHYLSPGQYTLAVEDEWNQTICAPFQVSATSNNHVGAVSVAIAGYSPEGHEVTMSLENIGLAPIASLNASLRGLVGTPTTVFAFSFNASSSNPVLTGQRIQSAPTLVGAGINTAEQYPLTVTGTLLNGVRFSYVNQVLVASSD